MWGRADSWQPGTNYLDIQHNKTGSISANKYGDLDSVDEKNDLILYLCVPEITKISE